MSSYTRNEIITKVNDGLLNINELYRQPVIDYKGTTTDTKELYSEVICEELLHHITTLNSVTKTTRKKSYYISSHANYEFNSTSNRLEDILAKKLMGQEIKNIGIIFDYQIPLKNDNTNMGGKIDLVSYDEDKNIIHLIELKYSTSKETLLKAVLQINTYCQVLDKVKFIENYKPHLLSLFKSIKFENISFQKTVLLIDGSNQFKELTEVNSIPITKRKYLKDLIIKLCVNCFELKMVAI